MNFPFFIARRYLFSKKKTHAINVISIISVIGVAVATMALVIVMSVFNGFHDLVASFFTNFDPQLKVVPVTGKSVAADDPALYKIKKLPQIDVATETFEDMALAVYKGRQAMVTIKGVDDNFSDLTHITDILYGDGQFKLHTANLEYGTPGIRLANNLGLGARWDNYLRIYAPQRQGQLDMSNMEGGFVLDSLLSSGVVFTVNNSKYDKGYILTSLGFARRLFDAQGELTALELRLKPGSNFDAVKSDIQDIAGKRFKVEDRYEQQADTFKIMEIEKLMAYIFLPKLSLRYKFNDQWNIYATAAKGFKAGGYNTAITANLMQDMMQHKSVGDVNNTLYYKPEYLWNYEIGMHAQPVDNKLFVDAAVFFIDDRDQQLVRSASNGTRKITNAERVHSYGAEASVRYLPIKSTVSTSRKVL